MSTLAMIESDATSNNRVLGEERLSLLIQQGGSTIKFKPNLGPELKEIHSLVEPIGKLLGRVEVNTTSIKRLCILGDVANLMETKPGLMANLLEAIPETLPNLGSIEFKFGRYLPNKSKFLLYLDTYILEPLMGHQALHVDVGKKGEICLLTDNFCIIWLSEDIFKSPFIEHLLQKPNLVKFSTKRSLPFLLYDHIFSSLSLKDLCLSKLSSPTRLTLLLLALKDCGGKGKKRKIHDHGFVGALHQLDKLQLGEVDFLGNYSHVLSLSKTIQVNNHLCHLVLDNLILQGIIEPTEAQLWEPFLDILRYNKTIAMIRVTYKGQGHLLVSVEQRSPYWEEHLFNVLVERNHRIVSISFGYNKRFGRTLYAPAHPNNTQLRLDLNYFGLSCFGTAVANQEEFPEALITAIRKEKAAQDGDRQIVPCLFQIITNNPLLLVNHL